VLALAWIRELGNPDGCNRIPADYLWNRPRWHTSCVLDTPSSLIEGGNKTEVFVSVRKTVLMNLIVLVAGSLAHAQTRLTLVSDVSSKMRTGTPFQAKDASGKIYHGHLVTHPARRMMRNGWMMLEFDEPVIAVTNDAEGRLRAGNKVRLLKVGGSLALAKLADDCVDGATGATRARFVGAAVSAAFLIFTKGEEAKLHAGDTVDVEDRR
jgi:hypothetical protein